MSKQNPTWLDEYYLVVMKRTEADIRRLMGGEENVAAHRDLVIRALNGPDTEIISEREYPRTGDVVRTFRCHSPHLKIDLRVTVNFTTKEANGGGKLVAFVEKVVDAMTPVGKN